MAVSGLNSNANLFDKLYTPAGTNANRISDSVAAAAKIEGSVPSALSSTVANTNSISSAIQQALVQLNAGRDISAFFNSDEGKEASSSFGNNLLSNLPGLSNNSNGELQAISTPIKLDPNSSSIQLQSSIQKLITQLDNGNSTTAAAGLGSLQDAFNSLVSKSGGEPSTQNLQSFLKLVAINVQGSTSIGSIFSTSA